MDWPTNPVERVREFRPPFCPWRDCAEHARSAPGYRYWKHASYATRTRPKIPRYRCLTCRRTFSRQAFSTSYYLKRPGLLRHVAAGLVAGSALRQIARSLDCAPNTVARMSARLGRHTMLLHSRCLTELRGKVYEPFVFDHFETFELTQDYPFGIGTAVGAESWFVYGLDPAPHGRSGRRSAAQERRLRSRPRRRTHGRYVGSTRRIFDTLLDLGSTDGVRIRADGHPDYQRAVQSDRRYRG
jgi:hypothetical protein